MTPEHSEGGTSGRFPNMGDPSLILDEKWMLVLTSEGLFEYKEDGDLCAVTSLKDYMLPQWRRMVYEWCLKTQQPSSKVEEIHNWLLQHTGRGL